jgi:hypothetical protein
MGVDRSLPFSFCTAAMGIGDEGASTGGLDHGDGIWLSFALHRPHRPRSAYD